MRKKILNPLLILFIAVFTLSSCKDNKKSSNQEAENDAQKTEEVVTETPEEAENATHEPEENMENAENKADETQENASDELREKLNHAIEDIQKSGNDFVKVIKDGGNKAEMEQAQNNFQEKAQDALDVYNEIAADPESGIDLNKASQNIQNAINSAQTKAAQAMKTR